MHLTPSNHRPWSAAFREYAEWNQRDGAELFVAQTRKLAVELYLQTAAVAPTKAEIAADVVKHTQPGHWDIPKVFPDGRTGRGEKRMAMGRAWSRKPKDKRTKAAKDKFFSRARATTAQVRAFVTSLRNNARLFVASGWLGAIKDTHGELPSAAEHRGALQGRAGVTRERGGANIRKDSHGVIVELWNDTPGIHNVERDHRIVERAIVVRTADMLVYIRRKMEEAAKTCFRR